MRASQFSLQMLPTASTPIAMMLFKQGYRTPTRTTTSAATLEGAASTRGDARSGGSIMASDAELVKGYQTLSEPCQPDRQIDDEEDSPYAEVRASVPNKDDPEALVLTLRTWILGLVFCAVASAINIYLQLRYPAPIVTPIISLLLSYLLGCALAKILPRRSWALPRACRRLGLPESISLNPGPFGAKEHAVIVMMVNVSTSPPYALFYPLVASKYYETRFPFGFTLLLVLSSQILGFGIAGLCRRFLIWPASMIWPQNLVYSTLLDVLHDGTQGATTEAAAARRVRFFLFGLTGAFIWYWIPGFLFTALSAFSWACWIAPDNAIVNQLFGVSSGLGMGFLTFDWSQIAYISNPFIIPWWAQINIFVGFICAFWIVVPSLYYSNVWFSAYLPISAPALYDRFGNVYNTSRVIDESGMHLNATSYTAYSPIYLSATMAVQYGVAFMLSAALITHTALYHGPHLWRRLRNRRPSYEADIHMKLMLTYRDVPDWWYLVFTLVALALAMIAVGCWDTGLPVWSVLVAFGLSATYFIPTGFIMAYTSYSISNNVLLETVAGYLLPGNAQANMLFKIYGMQVNYVGLYFAQGMKLGHYVKIPPRITFIVQVVAVAVTSLVTVAVQQWFVDTVPDLCDPQQADALICPYITPMYSASLIWGLIGPERLFGPHGMYRAITYFTAVGAVLPVLTWLLRRRFPTRWYGEVHVPIALLGLGYVPPANGINFSSPLLIGFVSQFFVRRRYYRWWRKYNYILSGALDAGTVLGTLVIFLTLQLPKKEPISLEWWGTTVFQKTLDWTGTTFRTPPPEGFGPASW
ncbi:hypothetical protein JCM10908_003556 [Rhodotorula pacifica]|uniref:uncharacterized protein n=1 Tax=Rhodotorula pacifica TaxID=1495444 RepID=UPI0031701DAD